MLPTLIVTHDYEDAATLAETVGARGEFGIVVYPWDVAVGRPRIEGTAASAEKLELARRREGPRVVQSHGHAARSAGLRVDSLR